MEISRCCDECPYYYSNYETDDYGCLIFGSECRNNKQFDDDVCYVHPKKLQSLAHIINKRDYALERKCNKEYRESWRKPVTSKEYKNFGKYNYGYVILENPPFLENLCKHYRPNMKGGHTHNHIYNKCHKHIFRSKQARKNVDRKDKPEFVRTFLLNIKLGNVTIDSLMHTIFHHNKKEYK